MNSNISDPITLEIIQNSLQATADEMFAAMRKTAMDTGQKLEDVAKTLISLLNTI